MRKVIAGLLLAVAMLGSVLIWKVGSSSNQRSGRGEQAPANSSTPDLIPRAQQPVQVPEPNSPRTLARPTVRVLDPDGHPLANVRVDRIPCPADWRARLDAWPDDQAMDHRNATRSGSTNADGAADLPELESGPPWDGSLLWAWAPGRQAAWLALRSTDIANLEPRELRLSPSKEFEVTVLGQDGQPVAGALVTERADFSDWPLLSDEARVARQFEFLPRVTAETDARGVAHLPVLPVRTWIQATADTRTTSSWTGTGPRHITLRLVATCLIDGRVVDESGEGASMRGAVSCQVRLGYDRLVVALAPVRASGEFGPVRLPLASTDGFMFQYFGGDLEAAQVTLSAPEPGSRSSIELRTRSGQGVELHVSDEDGRPLADVNAVTQWSRNDVWNRVDRRTNSEGRARLANLPTGEVWVRMRKAGYVPELRQLFRAEQWVHYPLEVKMHRAATVQGKCTLNGTPVQKFTVCFWQQSVKDGGKLEIEDSEDGTFKIEEAAPGLVQLLASSDDVVQSAPASLSVEPGAVGKVSLEFASPRQVRGQVVDAASGEPIPSVRLSALIITGSEIIKPWKTSLPVTETGQFDFAGLGTVEGMLEFSGPGFATREVTISPGSEPRIDLGRIALHRVQSLVVRLHSTEPTDFASYGLSLKSVTKYLPGIRFPADGLLRIDDLSPGGANLTLESSSGATEGRDIRIRSGGTVTCDFYLEGEPLEVEVVPPSGSEIPEKSFLGVSYVDRHGAQLLRMCAITASGDVQMGRIDTSRVLLEVLSADGKSLAMGEYEVPTTSPRRLVVVMNPQPLRLRILDESHAPVVGAAVYLTGHPAAVEWRSVTSTDKSGEALVPEVGNLDLRIGVSHVGHAPVPCAPISAADAVGGVVEIVMHPGIAAELLLRDGGDALPGVQPELTDSCGTVMSLGQVQAGEDGRVRIPHLAPGDYRVVVDHPGIWRTEQPITVTATSTSFTVQLRRLGSARVRVRTGAGNPIEGASVELIDVATGVRVADWIQSGEVPAPSGGLRTDANGALVVHGVPRGSYRCVVNTSSGAMLERTLEVPPQATGELEAVIP